MRSNSLLLLAWIALILHTVFATSAIHAAENPPTVDVYLLSGQSNMAGSGQASQLAEMWQQPVEGAFIYQGGAYKSLVAGKDGKSGRFGPEVGFAHYMTQNNPKRSKIFIIKFALSGQPLDAGWTKPTANGGGWVGPEPGPNRTTFYPGTSPEDPNIGLHYKRLHAHVTAALKSLKDKGHTPHVRGIVWMQGEADAKHDISAGRYDQSLALFKQRLESDFAEGKNVPFVFGQVLPHEPALERFKARDLIRQRMAEVDHRSGDKRAVENIWMVPTEGMELLKDTVHYSTKGQLAMGQAFGLEMLKAHRAAELKNAKQHQ
jgi:hypothetical protein